MPGDAQWQVSPPARGPLWHRGEIPRGQSLVQSCCPVGLSALRLQCCGCRTGVMGPCGDQELADEE